MARSRCPNCGAPVDLVEVDGQTIPLDLAVESSEAPCYVIVGHNPLRAVKVNSRDNPKGQSDHRFDCPAHNAGRP